MERDVAEIRKLVQRLENMFERFIPLVDNVEQELRIMREILEKHDRREEIRENRQVEAERQNRR